MPNNREYDKRYDYRLIKQQVRLADILRDYGIELNRNVDKQMVCCPFHEDKTPSMSIDTQRNMFKCFGCGAGGSVLDFVRLQENCSLNEAAKILGDKYLSGLPGELLNYRSGNREVLQESKGGRVEESRRRLGEGVGGRKEEETGDEETKGRRGEGGRGRQIQYAVNDDDMRIYKRLYTICGLSEEGRKYLVDERGFNAELIKKSRIGSIDNIAKVECLLKSEFSDEQLDHAGLLYYKKNLIFFDKGLLIFYWLGDEIVYVNQRKYPGYKGQKYNSLLGKAKHFYCLNPDSDKLTVVEGEIDALAYNMITGDDKVIACCGVGNARADKLDNYLGQMGYARRRKYRFLLDSDKAGRKAVDALVKAGEDAFTVDDYCLKAGLGSGFKDFGEVIASVRGVGLAG
ncbi:MAG: toprim domain-containing protein [Candidatus Cloacimonetes bacterium]|nr:toprim domain-containing protein [Candidatus Cloacimonadota bacterium]